MYNNVVHKLVYKAIEVEAGDVLGIYLPPTGTVCHPGSAVSPLTSGHHCPGVEQADWWYERYNITVGITVYTTVCGCFL